MHNVLQTIRKKTNEITANAVRVLCHDEIVTRVKKAVAEAVSNELLNAQLKQWVDTLVMNAANLAVDSCASMLPGVLEGEVKNAIVASVQQSGQHISKVFLNYLPSFQMTLQEHVAQTVSQIIAEAMVSDALTKTSKALPMPEESNEIPESKRCASKRDGLQCILPEYHKERHRDRWGIDAVAWE